jgi:hypothetical protein
MATRKKWVFRWKRQISKETLRKRREQIKLNKEAEYKRLQAYRNSGRQMEIEAFIGPEYFGPFQEEPACLEGVTDGE